MDLDALLQNNNSVPHMAVNEVNPEVGPDQCPALTTIKWGRNNPVQLWEGDAVHSGLSRGSLSLSLVYNPMLQLVVVQQ